MHSPRRGFILAGLLTMVGAFLGISVCSAQDATEAKGEKVRFSTVDGVELQGLFYSAAKRNSATILMLHALGEDSRRKSWTSLAEALNAAGCAVLTFDFRGQGQSTSVEPTVFWHFPRNVSSVRGAAQRKETIEFKGMSQQYYPVMVNDIAAAKAFLDGRNDTGGCNSGNLIVVGAETGAALGSIWLNAEWHRYAYTPPNFLMNIPARLATVPEGKKTIGAIWLSAKPRLGTRTIQFASVLALPARVYATPMVFMFSDKDAAGKALANASVKYFKGAKSKDDKYSLTAAVPVDGGGKLAGAALLQKSLGTEDSIVGYVKNVVDARGNEWEERDFRKTLYNWKFGNQQVAAKKMGMTLIEYSTYEAFAR